MDVEFGGNASRLASWIAVWTCILSLGCKCCSQSLDDRRSTGVGVDQAFWDFEGYRLQMYFDSRTPGDHITYEVH